MKLIRWTLLPIALTVALFGVACAGPEEEPLEEGENEEQLLNEEEMEEEEIEEEGVGE